MTDIYLTAVGTELPGPPIDNETLGGAIGVPAEWIDLFVGTRTRHLATDPASGEATCDLADLGTRAAERALTTAGLPPGAIDFVVMSTATPDRLLPTTVNMIADRVGVDGVPTYQLQAGCAGAFAALELAAALLRGGGHTTGLVIGADISAKHLDLRRDASTLPRGELVNYVLFGDAAGAAVVSTRPDGAAVAITRLLHRLVGAGSAPGQVVEWFGVTDRRSERPALTEDYKAIEHRVPQLARAVRDELAAGPVDFLLPPQLSGRMTRQIVAELALPDADEVSCVEETGNTANALPFLQLERLLPKMRGGQRALAISIESSKWILAGAVLERRG